MGEVNPSDAEMPVLSGADKAAALFLVMGKESSIRLAEYFSEDELKLIVEAAQQYSGLSFEAINQLVAEFGRNYIAAGMTTGFGDLSQLLDKPANDDKDNAVTAGLTNSATGQIPSLDLETVQLFFQTEPPHICALLLTKLPDDQSVKVLSALESQHRNEIFHAYLNRRELDEDVLSLIEVDLIELIGSIKTDEGNDKNLDYAAGLINQLSAENSDELIEFLETDSPEYATVIKKSLFKFSSIELLNKEARSVLFDSVQSEDIVKALTGVGDGLKESVLEVLSQRNRRVVESELARGQTSEEDAEIAQRQISTNALALAREGKLELPQTE